MMMMMMMMMPIVLYIAGYSDIHCFCSLYRDILWQNNTCSGFFPYSGWVQLAPSEKREREKATWCVFVTLFTRNFCSYSVFSAFPLRYCLGVSTSALFFYKFKTFVYVNY